MTNTRRRQVLISLAGAALLVASGCAAFRRDSELDAALAELETLLTAIGGDKDDDLVAIAEKINAQSRGLLQAHDYFATEFNRQAADRTVSESALSTLVRNYDSNRTALRNQLLHSQDELHAAVPQDSWAEVLDVLNRKSRAVVPVQAREA